MLLTNPTDPQTQRTRALQRVYALLLRLAEDENKTADSDNLGRETLSAGQDPKPQGKESKP